MELRILHQFVLDLNLKYNFDLEKSINAVNVL